MNAVTETPEATPEEKPETATPEETTEEETPETPEIESLADALTVSGDDGTFTGTEENVAGDAALIRRDVIKLANAEETATKATKAIAARLMAFALLVIRPGTDGQPEGPDWNRQAEVSNRYVTWTVTVPLREKNVTDEKIKTVQARIRKEIERNARPKAIAAYLRERNEAGELTLDGAKLDGDALKARTSAEYKRVGLKDPFQSRTRTPSGPKGNLENPAAELTNVVSAFANTVKAETDGGQGKRVAPYATLTAAHRLVDTAVSDYVTNGDVPDRTSAIEAATALKLAVDTYLEAIENGSKDYDALLATAFVAK